jgi:hypothetical protein
MKVSELGVTNGGWLAANFGAFPSENNYKLVIMGPESQREDLVAAVAAHTINTHGHADTPQLQEELGKLLEPVTGQFSFHGA